MSKIESYQNWCEVDQLDGKDLQNGERLKVRWPNGKEEVITIIVNKSTGETSDMGRPYHYRVWKAVWRTTVNHVKVEVPLVGIEAVRVS